MVRGGRAEGIPSAVSLMSCGDFRHAVEVVLAQLALAHQELAAQIMQLHVERILRIPVHSSGRVI